MPLAFSTFDLMQLAFQFLDNHLPHSLYMSLHTFEYFCRVRLEMSSIFCDDEADVDEEQMVTPQQPLANSVGLDDGRGSMLQAQQTSGLPAPTESSNDDELYVYDISFFCGRAAVLQHLSRALAVMWCCCGTLQQICVRLQNLIMV